MRRGALEPLAWVAALTALAGLLLAEGRRRTALERRLPVAAREVYRLLSRPQASWQVLDVRADLSAGYEDAHVPGALPMPACDPARTPPAALARIVPSAPTIVVSEDGDPAALRACLARFTAARALEGGMGAWSDASLPEDSGEYTPPPAKAGGGCL